VIDIFWQQHPDYTKEWSIETRRNIGEKRWLQEYECNFLGTGDTFIDGGTLKVLKDNFNDDFDIKYNNRMRVWKDPEPFKEYVIGVDVSLGVEKDYSAFHIIDIYTGEQVAEFYSNKTSVKDFGNILKYEGDWYNTAYMIVERNGIGIELLRILFEELEYENLWMDDTKNQLGLTVTTHNRDGILASLEEFVRNNKIKVNSERTVKELLTFIITENNKIEAEVGYNDDLTMSLALTCYAFKDILDFSPIEYSVGESKSPEKTFQNNPQRAMISRVNKNMDKEDLRWLYGPRR
jgi:hypothetical protein